MPRGKHKKRAVSAITSPAPEALRPAASVPGPAPTAKSPDLGESDEPESQSIRVVVRFRPVNSREKREEAKTTFPDLPLEHTQTREKGTIKLFTASSVKPHQFVFDGVLAPDTTQEASFMTIGEKMCDHMLQGYNTTLFGYGQTGSGKTYTIYGDEKNPANPLSMGIIPRAVSYIFDTIEHTPSIIDASIKVSFLEIYQEKLKDLLCPGKTDLRIRLFRDGHTWVSNLTETGVESLLDVLHLIEIATSYRTRAETDMNATSSRSHMLMTLHCAMRLDDGSARTGKVNFVDLAGSEKVRKTGATGTRFDEAKSINLSLTILGQVISALARGSGRHVPYRDSMLTHTLKDSLGGNCRTTLVVCCSPHAFNREETLTTLRFGMRCKLIKNTVTVNRVFSNAELMVLVTKLKSKVSKLKKSVKKYKRMAKKGMGADSGDISEDEDESKGSRGKKAATASYSGYPSGWFPGSGEHLSTTSSMTDRERARLEQRIARLTVKNQELTEELQDLRFTALTASEEQHELHTAIATQKQALKQLSDAKTELLSKVGELEKHTSFADDANLKLAHAFTTLKTMFQAEQKRVRDLQEAKIRQSEKLTGRLKRYRSKAKASATDSRAGRKVIDDMSKQMEESNALLRIEATRSEQLKTDLLEVSRKMHAAEDSLKKERKRSVAIGKEMSAIQSRMEEADSKRLSERTKFEQLIEVLKREITSRTEKYQIEAHELRKQLNDRERLTTALSIRGGTLYDSTTDSPPGIGRVGSGLSMKSPLDIGTPATTGKNPAMVVASFQLGATRRPSLGVVAHSETLRRRASIVSVAGETWSAEELQAKEDTLIRQETYLRKVAQKRRVTRKFPKDGVLIPPTFAESRDTRSASFADEISEMDSLLESGASMEEVAIESQKKEMQARMGRLESKLEQLRSDEMPREEYNRLEALLEIANTEDELKQLRGRYKKLRKLEKKAAQLKKHRSERHLSLSELADSASMTPSQHWDAAGTQSPTSPTSDKIAAMEHQPSFGMDLAAELSREFSKFFEGDDDSGDDALAFPVGSVKPRRRRKRGARRKSEGMDFK